MRLLLVEDEVVFAEKLMGQLEQAGYAVDHAATAHAAEVLFQSEAYRVAILDIGLPVTDGLTLLRKWRLENRQEPVLLLTARSKWMERVEGLRAGADDYLPKPFHFEELVARLEVIVRRSEGRVSSKISAYGFTLNDETRSLECPEGASYTLTATEYRLLRCFMARPGRVFSVEELIDELYNIDRSPTLNVIQVYITRLRKMVGKEYIRSLRGQGYYFSGPDNAVWK
ncbi:response regulator transcription factor [Marinobacter sp.]|uniref:response regulator transcription factor n=1 Tax=Marinobacter sp. TaxID=50741 RepID=UPI001B68ECF4|nr:response regulator transcription factor [Marinobacter sp.]MBQ0832700.1 response regulator transcription factor [Marinobacter sp.]